MRSTRLSIHGVFLILSVRILTWRWAKPKNTKVLELPLVAPKNYFGLSRFWFELIDVPYSVGTLTWKWSMQKLGKVLGSRKQKSLVAVKDYFVVSELGSKSFAFIRSHRRNLFFVDSLCLSNAFCKIFTWKWTKLKLVKGMVLKMQNPRE